MTSLLVIKYYKKQQLKELQGVLQCLDIALSGKEQIVQYDETIKSALGERLNQLVKVTNHQAQAAKKENERVQILLSDISHQIKTPLANILLYSQLLQEKMIDENDLALSNQLVTQSEKLVFFMNELLRASQLETNMITIQKQENTINHLWSAACLTVEPSLLKKQIRINQEDSDILGLFDMKWTIEALVNLLENAIKYSPSHSTIYLSTTVYESFISLNIKDQGLGISEEEQGLIFNRFYRSPSVQEEPGVGIGLYLTREIITKQGGYIKVHSELNQGTTFQVFLPKN